MTGRVRGTSRALVGAAAALVALAAFAAPAQARVVAEEPDAVREIIFPVAGETYFSDTFGSCRSGCTRQHEGTDLMAAHMTPLVAARDARVTAIKRDATPDGSQGNYIFLTDEDGWSYWYIHTNNDTPGTDDGANPEEWLFAPGLERGSRVSAGQLISWVGDSGNAEHAGHHLHFEIHTPEDEVINPYQSLLAAERLDAPLAGDLDLAPETSLLTALTQDFLRRDPTDVELAADAAALAAGTPHGDLIADFASSDEWVQALVDTYYEGTLGRPGEDEGKAYWADVIRAGRPPANVAADFYASDEYHARVGGTDEAWLADLFLQLRDIEATEDDLSPWLGALGAGEHRSVIAFDFFQSIEHRRHRVTDLYQSLLLREPDADGLEYWAEILESGEDVELAIFLASSEEYVARSVERFPAEIEDDSATDDEPSGSSDDDWTWRWRDHD